MNLFELKTELNWTQDSMLNNMIVGVVGSPAKFLIPIRRNKSRSFETIVFKWVMTELRNSEQL